MVPARARPVPFWRHGFERPPETSPRDFAPRVPARSAFSSARTASCTRCGLTSAPKTASSSSKFFDFLPDASSRGALTATVRLLLPDLEQPALRAGHGALDEEQVALGIDRVHDEADLRAALAAHPARHLDALEDARRRCRRPDRARLADVVRAVRDGAAVEVVPLDGSLEALADARAADLDGVARLERLDRHRLARDGLGGAAELDEVPVRLDVVLLQVADLGLRQAEVCDRLIGELHGLVAVNVRRLDLDDRTRAGLDHRHRRDDAGLRIEDLRHAQFSAQDPLHRSAYSLISMSTPAGRSSRISESTVFGVGE